MRFVGLKNYAYLLHDLLFWDSLANTAIYVFIFLLIQIPLSLFLAVQLNNQRVIGRNVLRFAFFSTSLVGPVFAAVIFSQFLNPRHDLVALLCSRWVGHSITIPWLTNPVLARIAAGNLFVQHYAAVTAKQAVVADALAKCVLLCTEETATRVLLAFDAAQLIIW